MYSKQTIVFCCSVVLALISGCAADVKPEDAQAAEQAKKELASVGRDSDRLLIVDCLLPGQLRSLGRSMSFLTPRRPVKVSASECAIRGGEYVAYDRANFATSLKIWLPKAKGGDAEAQVYVGEIFEKGLGQLADPTAAAEWYKRAAEQGNTRAHINLGYLYETGLGVERNLVVAMNHYRSAAGFEDSQLEYVTSMEVVARKAREQQFVDMEGQLAKLEASNRELLAERASLQQQNARVLTLERQVEEKRKEVAALVSQVPPAAVANETPTTSVASLLAEIAQLELQLSQSDRSNKELFAQLSVQQQQTGALRKKVADANFELSEAREKMKAQQNRVRAIENRLADRMDSEASTAEQSKLTTELAEELQQELAAATQEIADQEGLIARLEQSQSSETLELNRQLTESESREDSLKASLAEAQANLDQLGGVVRNKERDYQQKLAENDRLQSESSLQLREKQNAIAELELQVSTLQTREVVNESEIAKTRSRISQLEQEVADQRAQLAASGDFELQASVAAVELATLEDELEQQRLENNKQQDRIEDLERDIASTRNSVPREEPAEQRPTTVAAGPLIEIIEPPVTIMRGAFALPTPRKASNVELIGRVRPADKVISFKVNGARNELNANGIFTFLADLDDTPDLRLTAVDDAGERAELNLTLIGDSASASGVSRGQFPVSEESAADDLVDISDIRFGNYHALIIGNQDYEHMGDLRTSLNDAIELERVLRVKYGFSTELLQNANRFDILAALNRKRDELTEDDNLLIYFAGHGELTDGKGYWLPTDSKPDSTDNWISSVSVTDLVDSMDAKHVMIVADSCYSGTLSRSSVPRLRKDMPAAQKAQWYENVSESKVRTVLTSGGVRPVIDGLPESRHSIFADAFIGVLNSSDGVVEAYNLFVEVQQKVRDSALSIGMEQDPRYSPIQFAGHESGEFLFVGAGG